jgi:hypothetical protein
LELLRKLNDYLPERLDDNLQEPDLVLGHTLGIIKTFVIGRLRQPKLFFKSILRPTIVVPMP